MSMVPEEYERMAALEDSMWWYHGLHHNVVNALRRFQPEARDILDAGCGTGGTLSAIKQAFPDAMLNGLDIAEQACDFTSSKTGASVTVGSVDALPYPDASFDALVSLDVLGYAIDLDAAVAGFLRVLRPGGLCVINLAAYQWMLSYHDRAVGQVRRFHRREALALLHRHGFQPIFASYWNTLLFPFMVLRRKILPAPPASDVTPFHPMVNRLFKACVQLESLMLARRMNLPFGGSLFIVARSPGS
ncbi:MAG TPA: class I SAM-dependent methyltransferase [Flavobacteriales bacterium]|nr:class I SAM-dependent methyltransferase [Flavobacteriales bacterium]HNU57900.1 class I SAM-dependent methyltransferase [Flavobacteriales bacterium]